MNSGSKFFGPNFEDLNEIEAPEQEKDDLKEIKEEEDDKVEELPKSKYKIYINL